MKKTIFFIAFISCAIMAQAQSWSRISIPFPDTLGVSAICSDAAGNIYTAGGKVSKWDGTNWTTFDSTINGLNFNGRIESICVDGAGNIYVGGFFTNSNGNIYVAKWNGVYWSELGGLNNLSSLFGASLGPGATYIESMCVDVQGNIYAAGTFLNLSGSFFVAKYNGTTWSELASATDSLRANSLFRNICTDPLGNIYAAGAFTNAKGNPYVAKWNGTTWSEVASATDSLRANNYIWSLYVDAASNVYAGGGFTDSSGLWYVAKWNGKNWSKLTHIASKLLPIYLLDLGYRQFMCGDVTGNLCFRTTDTLNQSCICQYHNNGWCELGGDNSLAAVVSNVGNCISDPFGNIYVLGGYNGKTYLAKSDPHCFSYYITTYDTLLNTFTLTVDTSASNHALSYYWNFGDGFTSTSPAPSHVYSIDTVYNVCLTIHNTIGDSCTYCHIIGKDYLGHIIKSTGFSINVKNSAAPTGLPLTATNPFHISISPNPCSHNLSISGYQSSTNLSIQLFDVVGRKITVPIAFTATESCQLNIEHLPSGIYFVEVQQADHVFRGKVVKQ
jgi:hypothetical protein